MIRPINPIGPDVDIVVTMATENKAGLMTPQDKIKINNILYSQKTLYLPDFPDGGIIGTAIDTVDVYSFIAIEQSTFGQTLFLPNPSNIPNIINLFVINKGSSMFIIYNKFIYPGNSALCIWNGDEWKIIISSSVTPLSTYNVVNINSDYIVINWNTIVLIDTLGASVNITIPPSSLQTETKNIIVVNVGNIYGSININSLQNILPYNLTNLNNVLINQYESITLLSLSNTCLAYSSYLIDSNFIGASNNTDGKRGWVPAPLSGQENYFLRGDATWQSTALPVENILSNTIITANINTEYHVNTSLNNSTIILPASPINGSLIRIIDVTNSWALNNLIIIPSNLDKINNNSGNLIINSGNIIELFYNLNNGNWITYVPVSNIALSLPDGKIFVGNSSNIPNPVFISGDITINNNGVATIANNIITNDKLSQINSYTWKGNNSNNLNNVTDNLISSLVENTSSVLLINGTNNILNNTTIEVKQSSGSQSGYLSSIDWNTFNNKQNEIINPVSGTGNISQIALFDGTNSITGINENSAFNKNFESDVNNIKMDGTASLGTSSNIARSDHVHPSDTTKQNIITNAVTNNLVSVNNNGQVIDSGHFTTTNTLANDNFSLMTSSTIHQVINDKITNVLIIQGVWDALNNIPSLEAGTGIIGHAYYVSTAGTQTTPSGSQVFYSHGDLVFYTVLNIWDRLESSNEVNSVFGRTGLITSENGDYNISQITNGLSNQLNNGNIFIGNINNIANSANISGDASLNNTGLLTINNNVINNSKLAEVGGRTWKGNNSDTIANVSDNLCASLTEIGSSILTINGTNSVLNAATIQANLNNGNIYIGNASNIPIERTLTGDITISNTGISTIRNDVNLNGNPTLTNTPASGNNTKSIATTEFVQTGLVPKLDKVPISVNIANRTANGSIGSAATTVNIAERLNITQTTANIILSLPTPSSQKFIFVHNAGTASFTMHNIVLPPSRNTIFLYNGTAWIALSSQSSSAANTSGTLSAIDNDGNLISYADTSVSASSWFISNSAQNQVFTFNIGGLNQANNGLTVSTILNVRSETGARPVSIRMNSGSSLRIDSIYNNGSTILDFIIYRNNLPILEFNNNTTCQASNVLPLNDDSQSLATTAYVQGNLGSNYSINLNTETLITDRWLSNKLVYRKVITFTNIASGIITTLDPILTRSYCVNLIRLNGQWKEATVTYPLPYNAISNINQSISSYLTNAGLVIDVGSARLSTNSGYVIIEYTKN